MPLNRLQTIATYCDRLLAIDKFVDWPGAANGLQVANNGVVSKIAATVDASLATIDLAIAAQADLLLVHHGLFWGPTHPWTGRRYQMLERLIKNNLAVYSSHLPLDSHPRHGNNALLAASLGFKNLKPFFEEKNQFIGLQTVGKISRLDLASRLESVLRRQPLLIPGGPVECRRIGVVTGRAGDELRKAAHEGVDTFITGEGRHWTYALAEELGLNVFYGGHYATETFGVKSLASHLSVKFKCPWVFLDHPTGL